MSTKCILCTQEIHRKLTENSQKALTGKIQEIARKNPGNCQEIARKGSQGTHRKLSASFQENPRESPGISQLTSSYQLTKKVTNLIRLVT